MRVKNKNFKIKKGIEAGLEIVVLIVSILAVGYILGDEFRLVKASGDGLPACTPDFEKNFKNKYYCSETFQCYDSSEKKVKEFSGSKPLNCKDLGSVCGIQEDGCGSAMKCGDCKTNEICINNKYCQKKECTQDKECNGKKCLDGHCVAIQNENSESTTPYPTKGGIHEGNAISSSKDKNDTEFYDKLGKNAGDLAANALVATGLYAGGAWFGANVLKVSNYSSQGLGWALGLGFGIGAAFYSLGNAAKWNFKDIFGMNLFADNAKFFGSVPWLAVYAAAAAAVIWLGSQDYSYDLVTFSCNSWQPVAGGTKCDDCNRGPFPCTKYKCQSLGQSCELANEGTDEEYCFWKNRNDISPPTIKAWTGALSQGYKYVPDDATLAPDTGVIIKYESSSDGCLPPYTTLKYGVSLDKLGKCKIDTVRKTDYDSMGLSLTAGMSKYNHTIVSYSGGINNSESGLTLANGGNYETYVRCQSQNGYSNVGTFVFKYCISKEKDTSAPKIIDTDPTNGNPVAFEQTNKDINVYVNKPSECRWSHSDVDFDLMTENMICSSSSTLFNANVVFKCSTTLTGLKDGVSNSFYMRCKSYPGEAESNRYRNVESYKYTLVGTRPLALDWVTPNGTTIKDSTDSINVTLSAHTSAGYKEGEAQCYYKDSSQTSDDNYVLFFSDSGTYNYEHAQELWLEEGDYSYDVKCCDLGGNCETASVQFGVETDTDSPIVIRIYNDNNKLKIVTDEKAECVYSTTDCSYLFTDGIKLTTSDYKEHLAEWNTASNLYIKCQDEFGNQPRPASTCTITVRPFSEYITTTA